MRILIPFAIGLVSGGSGGPLGVDSILDEGKARLFATDLPLKIEMVESKDYYSQLWREVKPFEQEIRQTMNWNKDIFEEDIQEIKRRAGLIDPELTDEERLTRGFEYTLSRHFNRSFKDKIHAAMTPEEMYSLVGTFRKMFAPLAAELDKLMLGTRSKQRPGEEIVKKFINEVVVPFVNEARESRMEAYLQLMEVILRRPGLKSDFNDLWTQVEPWEKHILASQVFGTEIAKTDMNQLKLRAGVAIPGMPDKDRMRLGFTDVMGRIFSYRYKSKLLSATTTSDVDREMSSIKEEFLLLGNKLNSLWKQIGSEKESGTKSALEYITEVVVPFADQCKAALIAQGS